jgi:ABC-type Fe3+ transport system permease subunit
MPSHASSRRGLPSPSSRLGWRRGISYLIPWFILFTKLKMIDTYTALILTHLIVALPLVLWVMIGFFEDVPLELEEAAYTARALDRKTKLLIGTGCVRHGAAPAAGPGQQAG